MATEMGKSQEALQLHSERGLGPIHHHFHISRIHLHITSSDDVSKEGDGGAMELAFLRTMENQKLYVEVSGFSGKQV